MKIKINKGLQSICYGYYFPQTLDKASEKLWKELNKYKWFKDDPKFYGMSLGAIFDEIGVSLKEVNHLMWDVDSEVYIKDFYSIIALALVQILHQCPLKWFLLLVYQELNVLFVFLKSCV